MGVLTSQHQDQLTPQVKEMIDQGKSCQEIADQLKINANGVIAIFTERKDRVCVICKGTGQNSIAKCSACSGLGAT